MEEKTKAISKDKKAKLRKTKRRIHYRLVFKVDKGTEQGEADLCCDRVKTFCKNDRSILTHGGNLHRCCRDRQTDTKQIVPNSSPCSTTGK